MRAHVVVNATGVWADEVRALDEPSHPHSIRPAKGIHVTVSRAKLPADIAAVIPVPKDRRSIFVVPWPDGDDVYLGTTDTDWEGSLDDPACLPDDVDYVLDAANGVVTEPIGRADVTAVWAGLRPLLAHGAGHHVSDRTAGPAGAGTPCRRPRTTGLVTVTGGKLTTYRRMAEDTVDVVVKKRLGSQGTGAHAHGAAPSTWQACTARPVSTSCDAPGAAARLPRRRRGRLGGAGGSPRWRDSGGARAGLGTTIRSSSSALVPGLPHLRVEAVWAVRSRDGDDRRRHPGGAAPAACSGAGPGRGRGGPPPSPSCWRRNGDSIVPASTRLRDAAAFADAGPARCDSSPVLGLDVP